MIAVVVSRDGEVIECPQGAQKAVDLRRLLRQGGQEQFLAELLTSSAASPLHEEVGADRCLNLGWWSCPERPWRKLAISHARKAGRRRGVGARWHPPILFLLFQEEKKESTGCRSLWMAGAEEVCLSAS